LSPKTGAVIRTLDPASTPATAVVPSCWEMQTTGVISATAHSVEVNRIEPPVGFLVRDGEGAFASCACRTTMGAPPGKGYT
jgi:hypothetical protein